MNYELIKGDPITDGCDYIKKTEADGKIWIIPIEPANSDYQAYLKWLENPTDTGWTEPTLTKF